jgi:hypothetical protein
MISRTNLIAGPCYITMGGQAWRMASDTTVDFVVETQEIMDNLAGDFTEIVTNRYLQIQGTPLYYDTTDTTAIFLPYISLAATPVGTQIFGTTDAACTITANSGLTIVGKACAVTKMPDLNLGADKPIFGALEIIGVNATGADPTTSSSFYAVSTGNSFTPPAIPGTATLARQKWTAVWGSVTGFSSFQSYDGFSITHKLGLKWITDNGQRIGALLTGYRPLCRCTPSANTIANYLAAVPFSGSGAAQGQQLAATADLVISGAVAGTITLKNAALKGAQVKFGGDALHQGPVQFVGTVGFSSGANVASLIVA